MSTDREARLIRVIDLLMEGTRDGSLEWEDSYGGYKTTLGGQTLVLERTPLNADAVLYEPALPDTVAKVLADSMRSQSRAALEIRGRKGEVLERIEEPDVVQSTLFKANQPDRFSQQVTDAVRYLYDLVASRREVIADAAIDNLLGALEGRVRAK